ncbi:hypothetical protein [Sinorhizobium meliloti]|uniref:hypothetical protein n=1 Tax=Rhizobium meliloti TaxID=382 RepID=UPI001F47E4A6|nr:hypothetical protein [Sinorhizobium meliloti]
MAALRQIAFYGKGGIGNSMRKPKPVTACIEDDGVPDGVRFASEDMTQRKVVYINRLKTQSQACSNPSTNQGAKNV